MDELRREVRASMSPTWDEIFAEIDTVAQQTKDEVKDVCETRFSGVIVAVNNAANENLKGIGTLNLAIDELRESLSVTARVEGIAKDGIGLIGKARELSKRFYLFSKDFLSGGVIIVIVWSALSGNMNAQDIVKFILKMTGLG